MPHSTSSSAHCYLTPLLQLLESWLLCNLHCCCPTGPIPSHSSDWFHHGCGTSPSPLTQQHDPRWSLFNARSAIPCATSHQNHAGSNNSVCRAVATSSQRRN